MTDDRGAWRSGELLAYTERDGPGRPPAASPGWLVGTLLGVVGVTFVGLLASDTLCPDHRAWVQGLATLGFVAIVASLVSLSVGYAAAPALALVACSFGVAIGLLDAAHSPTRGRLVALGFAVALALAAAATVRAVRLMRWDHRSTVDRAEAPDGLAAVEAPKHQVPTPDAVEEVDAPVGIDADR